MKKGLPLIAVFSFYTLVGIGQNYKLKIITVQGDVLPYSIRLNKVNFISDINGQIILTPTRFKKLKNAKPKLKFTNATNDLIYENHIFCTGIIESDTVLNNSHVKIKSGINCAVSFENLQLQAIFTTKNVCLYFKKKSYVMISTPDVRAYLKNKNRKHSLCVK